MQVNLTLCARVALHLLLETEDISDLKFTFQAVKVSHFSDMGAGYSKQRGFHMQGQGEFSVPLIRMSKAQAAR